MVHDSLQDDKHVQSRLKKAFRTTVQKCLLGAVMLATGSRAIYYTIQNIIPDKWGDILLNVYYPSLLSAFSLLICFWAEVCVCVCLGVCMCVCANKRSDIGTLSCSF